MPHSDVSTQDGLQSVLVQCISLFSDLGENQIGRILKISFRDLVNVATLDLDQNEIALIEDGTFAGVKGFSRL